MFRAMKAGGLENGRKVFTQLKAKDFPDVYPGSGSAHLYLGYGYLYRFQQISGSDRPASVESRTVS